MMEIGFRQSLRLSQRLSLEQKLHVQELVFLLRLELIQTLRGEHYKPKADCPNCRRQMTPVEIIKGFNQDPNDFTTRCSGCGSRFRPVLVCSGIASQIKVPFYCEVQTIEKLRGQENFSPEQISNKLPGVYQSAVIHFGGLHRAFEKLGVDYLFEELHGWRKKIIPFLGRLPDTVLAGCVDASVSVVRAMRRKLGVARHTLQRTLEFEEVESV